MTFGGDSIKTPWQKQVLVIPDMKLHISSSYMNTKFSEILMIVHS